ncbi:MAG: GNAT family N-acetyltransferase [Lachnospiraceae bacterium]|nr:GNAT family N-acetyltransferase [Lachnospiraceae bacterium]
MRFVRYDSRKHMDILHNIMMNSEQQYLFLGHNNINSVQEFGEWVDRQLRGYYYNFYLIEMDEKIVGYVCGCNYNSINRNCSLTTYICDEWQGSGIGALATMKYIDEFFRYHPIRRIYCEAYEYNEASLNTIRSAGLTEYGRNPEYRYFQDKYYDLILFSMSRDEYMEKYADPFWSAERKNER